MKIKKTGKLEYDVDIDLTSYQVDLSKISQHRKQLAEHFYKSEELNQMKAIIMAQNEEIQELDAKLENQNKANKEMWSAIYSTNVNLKNAKEFCKNWIDQNVNDGEDRSKAINDVLTFNPIELQELIFDMVDDLIRIDFTKVDSV